MAAESEWIPTGGLELNLTEIAADIHTPSDRLFETSLH